MVTFAGANSSTGEAAATGVGLGLHPHHGTRLRNKIVGIHRGIGHRAERPASGAGEDFGIAMGGAVGVFDRFGFCRVDVFEGVAEAETVGCVHLREAVDDGAEFAEIVNLDGDVAVDLEAHKFALGLPLVGRGHGEGADFGVLGVDAVVAQGLADALRGLLRLGVGGF